MRFAATVASLFALGAQARITGIGFPETVKVGESFKAIIVCDRYEEVVRDVSISIGYSQTSYQESHLGYYAGSYYFNEIYNKKDRFEREITIPASEVRGDGYITASLYSLYGEEYRPEVHDFSVNVKFGEKISDKYVYSHY